MTNLIFFQNPPPAAIEFLIKIREIMSVAKEKMTSKRFIPILSDIPEEELYHTIDLGWDIPCARRGRRFSAISLKHENSRRAVHCGGCPGCDSSVNSQKSNALARSNSCKTCVSDDYKQRIVRKWLDEVPLPAPTIKPVKSVAKVSGTPRVIEPKVHKRPDQVRANQVISSNASDLLLETTNDMFDRNNLTRNDITKEEDHITVEKIAETTQAIVVPEKRSPTNHKSRRIRKKLPPPPPPPVDRSESPKEEAEEEAIPPEVKIKMEAVIRELNKCRRVEPKELEEMKLESIAPIAPKIVIPVIAADSHYYSDDNILTNDRKKEFYIHRDNTLEFDSLERNAIRKRRFSLACEPDLAQKEELRYQSNNIQVARDRLSSSWKDIKKAVDEYQSMPQLMNLQFENKSEIFINAAEPCYNNVFKTGPLTIKVSGSPVESRRNQTEEFDPDTLDRKPKREAKKRVEKILLKSGGSFKFKAPENEVQQNKTPPEAAFTRKIGSLRQIYEAKTKVQENEIQFYGRRGSIPFISDEVSGYSRALKTPDLIRQVDGTKDHKPPIPPKQRRGSDASQNFSNPVRDSPPNDRRRTSEERDRFPSNSRLDNLNARRSGRRSARTRSRRTDLRKLCKTEDSGYMSTDSNDSKRRAKYLLQFRPKTITLDPVQPVKVKTQTLQIESDTDELESLCDGRSESGGESVETDSVFFGNFDDSKELFAELGLSSFELHSKGLNQEQIDSGFMGETNIILSGDSDSEHKSVISIIAGRDGRASAASIAKIEDPPYVHSVEC